MIACVALVCLSEHHETQISGKALGGDDANDNNTQFPLGISMIIFNSHFKLHILVLWRCVPVSVRALSWILNIFPLDHLLLLYYYHYYGAINKVLSWNIAWRKLCVRIMSLSLLTMHTIARHYTSLSNKTTRLNNLMHVKLKISNKFLIWQSCSAAQNGVNGAWKLSE